MSSLGAYYEISQGPISGIGYYERPGTLERYAQPYDGLGVDPAQNAPLPDPTAAARIACNMAQLTWDEAKQQCTQLPSGGQQPMPPNVGQLVVDCGRAGNVWDPISASCKYFPGPVTDPSIITQCTAAGKADWDAATKTCRPKPTVLGLQVPTFALLVVGAGALYYFVAMRKR